MEMKMETILVIDDDEYTRESIYLFLSECKYKVLLANNGTNGLKILDEATPDLIITDLRMPDITGIDVLKRVKEIDPYIQVLLITAFDDMQSIIEAMQMGAYDYIEKPLELELFKHTIQRALESKKLSERMAISIMGDSIDMADENCLVGKNPAMKKIFKQIGKISGNKVNILIQGESGTGKELVTRVIHYTGVTKDEPLIAVNCTALSETLLESELFGHVKGAFTGAVRDKKGKFELAEGGTIFLDEISEISTKLQAKLLRVLQEKEFERVGGETTIPMKARIIAATNQDLASLVESGEFREDLYYRLKVFSIDIPPLRERKEDIPNLVVHFLKKINKELHKNVNKITFEAMEMLQNYDWIGNVRELENTLLQAVVLANTNVIEKEHILLRKADAKTNEDISKMSLAQIEAKHIKRVLDGVEWDKKRACEILGISKPTLYSKMSTYNIKRVAGIEE
jgi:DNA-binding NtrC family response regulator